MSEQLVIPQEAKCQRCGLKSFTSQQVYESFGIRMVNGKLLSQAHCKKCRKQSLPKELRDKYRAWKEQHHNRLHENTLKIKTDFDNTFNKLRDDYKKSTEILNSQLKKERDKFQDQFNKDCEKKKQELEASVKS